MSKLKKMFIKSTLSMAVTAFFAFPLLAGNDYYVDANSGDDAWDGSTAEIPTGEQLLLSPVPGPRKTLAGAMAITELTSGDTVHAAPGVYNEGGMENSYGSNRVIVASGVLLVADQGASVTTIEGKISTAADNTDGCAEDSMRAVCLDDGAAVKGFTITKGRTNKPYPGGTSGNSCGAGVRGGLVVDCIISNNVAYRRGNAAYSATLLRCYIGNDPAGPWSCYSAVNLIDCVHDVSKQVYSACYAYNTTFVKGSFRDSGAYNCLFLSGHGSDSMTLRSCISVSAQNSATDGDGKCQFGVAKSKIGYDATTYRPLPGSLAFDAGNNDYYASATNSWTDTKTSKKAWWQTFITGKDYAGGDGEVGARIRGKAIDIGAGEVDPSLRMLTIDDAQTALVVTGAEKGNTILNYGETNTFTIARDYSTAKLLTGVNVNGEFFSFTGENADRTYEYTYGYGDPVANFVVEAVYAEHNDWYVNPNVDTEKGPVGDDANNGYTKYQPKRTLAGALSNTLVANGDTVHAAPGVYNEGTMAASSTATVTNRVIVKDGVGLVADEGSEVTAIEGFIPDQSRWGTTDPIRCVSLGTGAYVKGFTLRNAMASMGQGTGTIYGNTGGGVYGGAAIDCIITNCYAVRGGGAGSTALIRCRVVECHYIPNGTANPAGGTASITGECVYYGSAYDSWIGGAVGLSVARNSKISSMGHNSGMSRVYNCYIENDGGNLCLTNSLVKSAIKASSIRGEGSYSGIGIKFDENGRPDITDPTTVQYAIDKGNRDYYVYPSAFPSEAGKDLAGGQRIYNGQIDIGPGEYDRRGDFTRALTTRPDRLSVDVATADVVTNALGQVTLSGGDSVTLGLKLPFGGTVSFALDSVEGATVTVDGAAVAPAGGTFSFEVQAGEHTVVIAYEGEGQAAISDFALPRGGLIMIMQ